MIQAINHICFSVADLATSIDFMNVFFKVIY